MKRDFSQLPWSKKTNFRNQWDSGIFFTAVWKYGTRNVVYNVRTAWIFFCWPHRREQAALNVIGGGFGRPVAFIHNDFTLNLDIWLAVHHSITFLLLPTWYTDFLFIYINYIKLNSSTCFERNPIIIRWSSTQIVHMQPLVSSLSASDRLVQPLRKDFLP